MKTGSESIEAILRRRRILFAGFVARMEDTRLPKCVMFGELVGGAGSAEEQKKEWMGCLLDDLRVFGIHPDKWTIAAQDKGEWHKTAKQGAEVFMTKWIVAERVRAANMPERDGKDQGEGSPKQACSYWFARSS